MNYYLTQAIVETYLFLLDKKENGATKDELMREVEDFRKTTTLSEKARDATCRLVVHAVEMLYSDDMTREKYLEQIANAVWVDFLEEDNV